MGNKQKILIVDDKKENLFALEKILRETDAEIIKATTGNDALASSLEHKFALAILDVQMPGMDGYELSEILRADEGTGGLPIIFLTANSMAENDIFKGYRAGAVDYIVKPYKPEVLLGKANVFLELDRQKAELRRQRELLEAANGELEAFAYSVSHDLRAPLRAIDGFTKILLEDHAEQLDDEGKRVLNVVCENAGKMAQLIEDILSFSRIGRNEVSYTYCDMRKMVDQIVSELKPVIDGRNIDWNIGELGLVSADAAMLKQALVNLVGNAVKYSRGRNPASIEIRLVPSPAETKSGYVTYYIRDNGAGFDMKYAAKLFGVFQRLHGPDEFEGTGAGLAIVKRIIERHGGTVRGEGKVGEGATFYFTLPRGKSND